MSRSASLSEKGLGEKANGADLHSAPRKNLPFGERKIQMATALYLNSQSQTTSREPGPELVTIGNAEEHLAADLEALCEAGMIEAVRDPYNRVRYQVKARA